MHHVVITFFFLVTLSCARQGLPPGEKKDTEPPRLVSSSPASLSVGVSTSGPIVFEFSEPMNEESVIDNFLIVPIPSVWPVFSWRSRSRKLVVDLKESLRDSTTYIVSIGAKASDMHGNQLEGTITLAFSTGDTIENGKITGWLIPFIYFGKNPEKVSGIDVVAYRIEGQGSPPDPRNDVPDFFTQSGTDGSYEIKGLSQAVYRLFVIGDRDGNGFYSEGSDMIGIAPYDVAVAHDDSVAAPTIMVSLRDTTAVQLKSVRAQDSRRIELFFDRDIARNGIAVDIAGLDIPGLFVDSANSQMISVGTGLQENGKQYTVKTLRVYDRDGNSLVPLGADPVFTGTDRPDTTTLEIVDRGPTLLTPESGPVRLVFNRVLALPERPDSGFALADESGENLVVTRTASNELSIASNGGWKEKYRYSIILDSEAVRGVAGNRLSDSGRQLIFRVVPSDTLGYMKGSIVDRSSAGTSDCRILLRHIDTGTLIDIDPHGASEWSSGGILPGRYTALAFRDRDGDGAVFRGRVSPYRPAEPVAVLPDTISVTSRWTTEDIRFIFK